MNRLSINFLNNLKIASLLNKKTISIKSNEIIQKLLKLLYVEGLIQSYFFESKITDSNVKIIFVKIFLRYSFNKSSFQYLKIKSKPSNQYYLTYYNIARLNMRTKFGFFSTSLGFLSTQNCLKMRTGGTFLFQC